MNFLQVGITEGRVSSVERSTLFIPQTTRDELNTVDQKAFERITFAIFSTPKLFKVSFIILAYQIVLIVYISSNIAQ